MPWFHHYRLLSGLALGAIAAVYAVALYIEHVQGLDPCPLCLAQRLAFGWIALALVLGLIVNPRAGGRATLSLLIGVGALAGIGLAGRQLWLQSLPADQVPTCGFGLDFMLEAYPWWEVLAYTLRGTGDCAEVQLFLGLSIPWWSLMGFVATLVLSVWLWRMPRPA